MCVEGLFNNPTVSPATPDIPIDTPAVSSENYYETSGSIPSPESNPVTDWFKNAGSNLGLGVQVAGVVAKTFGAYNKSKLEKQAYDQQAAIAGMNAANDAVRARDAVEQGQDKAHAIGLKYGQLFGTQRAMLAARGIDISEGSPLLDDTAFARNSDYRINDKNTAMNKWAADVAYSNDKNSESLMKWRADNENPFAAGFSTLLGEGGTVAAHWYKRSA